MGEEEGEDIIEMTMSANMIQKMRIKLEKKMKEN